MLIETALEIQEMWEAAIADSPFLFVKAKDVQPGDEFVMRQHDGRVNGFVEVAETGRTCSDYGNVHISTRGTARFPSKHADSLRTECWFGETEVEVRRSANKDHNRGHEHEAIHSASHAPVRGNHH